jgi:hypothetical protein
MGHLNKSDYSITLSLGIKESILEYFSYARSALGAFQNYSKRHREIDFLKMRRFLNTTYKTMNEIDSDFMADRLSKLHKNVQTMAKIYDDFLNKSRGSAHSFETIFLQRQEDYVKYEALLTHNADEITVLREQADQFKKSVAEAKDRLKRSPKFLSHYSEKEENLKRLKRRENAVIVRLGHIIEENLIISELIRDFRDFYEDEFIVMFGKYTQNLKPELLSILNAMAFEFDVELWLKARESAVIQNYFKNAYAGDVISSKTYLTYYLKSLDPNKLNEEHKELQKLLDYLNETTPLHCVLYMPAAEDLERFSSALDADNNGIVIHGFSSAKVALEEAFKTRIDILILDLESQGDILENFLELYHKHSMKLKKQAKIVLIATEVNELAINRAEKLGADSLIEREVDTVEIIDIVYDLIKIENTMISQ